MHQAAETLPDNVQRVRLDGRNVYILGTAHISQQSVEDVRSAVQTLRPETVCVELCPSRYQSIVQRDAWRQMNIFRVIKENKALFLLLQLVLTVFYRKLGEKLGVEPGAEMKEGVRQAEETGARLVLADRDVNVTLKRVWGHLSFWHKCKLFFQLALGLFAREQVDEELIEELKNKDQLEVIMEGVARSYPEIKHRLIDERDVYIAHSIRNAPGETVLAVVGAGHVQGIVDNLDREADIGPLLEMPPPAVWPVLFKWGIPAIIAALLVLGFITGGTQHSVESVSIWILVNGIFSALAVSIALAHPLTVLSAFVAAPVTSLNPTIAAGWVAGLVQTWIKKPTVADMENLPRALTSLRVFWVNPLCRILLVVVLANLGSSLGTFVAGGWIAARFF
jgi:pheromone shutdown-related protein TraB